MQSQPEFFDCAIEPLEHRRFFQGFLVTLKGSEFKDQVGWVYLIFLDKLSSLLEQIITAYETSFQLYCGLIQLQEIRQEELNGIVQII